MYTLRMQREKYFDLIAKYDIHSNKKTQAMRENETNNGNGNRNGKNNHNNNGNSNDNARQHTDTEYPTTVPPKQPTPQRIANQRWIGSSYNETIEEIAYYENLIPKASIQIGEHIHSLIQENKHTKGVCNIRVVISGKQGIGKTMSERWLAHKLNATLWNSFNPTRPGVNIDDVISNMDMNDNALLITIDEVDTCVLDRLGKIQDHRNYSTSVTDKSTWNTFLDHLSLLNNVYLIMTTNKTREQLIEDYDPSLLRDGRIDAFIDGASFVKKDDTHKE